jgi:hypothetical protein
VRRALQLGAAVGAGIFLMLLVHPIAAGASDLWGNVAPASPLGNGGLFGRYPLGHYSLDQHFEAVEASLTGGVDVSGVGPMIAYFLASVLWLVTSFLANLLITLFAFAFSLDLVNGSQATGGAGALGPVSRAINAIYSDVFGAPWLVLAIAITGIWAMWKALVQRRYSETAGALGLSLIYVVLALFFVAQPGATIGSVSKLTNEMSGAFLSISSHGNPSSARQAKEDTADALFDLLVFKPWVVLNFGGLEHCVVAGTGSEDSDPDSVAVRPLSSNPARDAALAQRLQAGTEVTADGKVCINNANKYAPRFLRYSLNAEDHDERAKEYDALNDGDASELSDAKRSGYRLGVADKPATDAMEEGGQYQRLLLALVLFVGELGAILLLGSLAIGIILAQILLLLLLAFAPVALVAAAIPGRGHAFFKGWLEKLAGYLLRKAAYSLILATLLAVNGALATATAQLGWLMSFGLQALFFWAVFLQRKNLTESLIGIATGPGAPGRDNTLRLLALYAGARTMNRPFRRFRHSARSAAGAPGRMVGGIGARLGGSNRQRGPGASAPRFGTSYSAPVGGGYPSLDAPAAAERPRGSAPDARKDRQAEAGSAGKVSGKGAKRRRTKGSPTAKKEPSSAAAPDGASERKKPTAPERSRRSQPDRPAPGSASARAQADARSESGLSAELRQERERRKSKSGSTPPAAKTPPSEDAPAASPRRRRSWRRGRGR